VVANVDRQSIKQQHYSKSTFALLLLAANINDLAVMVALFA